MATKTPSRRKQPKSPTKVARNDADDIDEVTRPTLKKPALPLQTMTSIDSIALRKPVTLSEQPMSAADHTQTISSSSADYYAAAAEAAAAQQAHGDVDDYDEQPPLKINMPQQPGLADQERVPCPICSRKFLPDALNRHVVVCEKVSQRDRLRQQNREKNERVKRERDQKQAERLEARIAESVPELLRNKPTKQLRAADGGLLTVFQCTHCLRFFQQGTYERHFAFCEQQARCKGGGASKSVLSKTTSSTSSRSKTSAAALVSSSQNNWNAGVTSEGKLTLLNRRMHYQPPPPSKKAAASSKLKGKTQKTDGARRVQTTTTTTTSSTVTVKNDNTSKILPKSSGRLPVSTRTTTKLPKQSKPVKKSSPSPPPSFKSESFANDGDFLASTLPKSGKTKTKKDAKKAVAKHVSADDVLQVSTSNSKFDAPMKALNKNAMLFYEADAIRSSNGDYAATAVLTEIDKFSNGDTLIQQQKLSKAKKSSKVKQRPPPVYTDTQQFSDIEEFEDENNKRHNASRRTSTNQVVLPKVAAIKADENYSSDHSSSLRQQYDRQKTQIISRSSLYKGRNPDIDDEVGKLNGEEDNMSRTFVRKRSAKKKSNGFVVDVDEKNSLDEQLLEAEQILNEAKQSRAAERNEEAVAAKPQPVRRRSKPLSNENINGTALNGDSPIDTHNKLPSPTEQSELNHTQYPLSVAADQELQLLKSHAHKSHNKQRARTEAGGIVAQQPDQADFFASQPEILNESRDDHRKKVTTQKLKGGEKNKLTSSTVTNESAAPVHAADLRGERPATEQSVTQVPQSIKSQVKSHDSRGANAETNSQFIESQKLGLPTFSDKINFAKSDYDDYDTGATLNSVEKTATKPVLLTRKRSDRQKNSKTYHDILNDNLQRVQPLTSEEIRHEQRRLLHNSGDDADFVAETKQAIRAQAALRLPEQNRDRDESAAGSANGHHRLSLSSQEGENESPEYKHRQMRRKRHGSPAVLPPPPPPVTVTLADTSQIDSYATKKLSRKANFSPHASDARLIPSAASTLSKKDVAENHTRPKNLLLNPPDPVLYDFNSPSVSDLGIIDVMDDDDEDDEEDNTLRFSTPDAQQQMLKSKIFSGKNSEKFDVKELPPSNNHARSAIPFANSHPMAMATSTARNSRSTSRIRQPTNFPFSTNSYSGGDHAGNGTTNSSKSARPSRHGADGDNNVPLKTSTDISNNTMPKSLSVSASKSAGANAKMNKLYGIDLDKLDDWLTNWDGLSCHWCRFPYPKPPPAAFELDSIKYCVRCGTRRLRSSFKRAAALSSSATTMHSAPSQL